MLIQEYCIWCNEIIINIGKSGWIGLSEVRILYGGQLF